MDRDNLFWRLGNVIRVHHTLVNKEATETGVYLGQHHVLAYIANHPGCSQSEIANAMQQSAAAVSLSTKRLQEIGLIEKTVNADSLRANCVSITDKGRENGRLFGQVVERYNKTLFEGFTDEDLERLNDYVNRMARNLGLGEKK